MVGHGNLLANSEMIRLVYGNTRATTYVSWVPLYHDMGLILNVLQTLYVGSLCVLMAPVSFMQRPLTWLRAISDYRAEFATAPNFAFDLCVDRFRPDQMAGIDLSSWKIALNGAEPVRADNDGALHRDLRALWLRSEGVLSGLWARGGDAARLRRPTGTGARHAPGEPGGAATPPRSPRRRAKRTRSSSRAAARPSSAKGSRSSIRKRASGFGRVMSARSGFPARMSPRAIGKTPRPPPRPSGRASKGKARSAGFAPAISAFSTTPASSTSPGASRT